MELIELHKEIMKGKICPYCRKETTLINSILVYGIDYGMLYSCVPCDAYVGVHENSKEHKSLGRLANKELRYWKMESHKYFDVIWKEKHATRNELYLYLSLHLKLPTEYTHIGMFSVETCKKVVDWSKMMLNDLRRLDMDFDVDVEREHYQR